MTGMNEKKLKIEYVEASALKPNPKNPRKNEEAVGKLVKSIEAFGWTNPILASRDNTIIAGHTRLKAAKEKGIKEVPVVYLDLDPSDADVYMVADNKLTEVAEWDFDLLSDLMIDFQEIGKELELTGFDPEKIAELTGTYGANEGLTDDDDVPEPPDEPITQPGDKAEWQLETEAALRRAGFEVRNPVIWVKNCGAFGFGRYKFQHEPIFYCHVKGQSDKWYGDLTQTTVWQEKKPTANRLHPTMKPVEIVQRALVNSSKRGDIVLDLFMGSGTTLIAAQTLQRRCYGMEIDPVYCDVIVKRWEEFTGKKAVRKAS